MVKSTRSSGCGCVVVAGGRSDCQRRAGGGGKGKGGSVVLFVYSFCTNALAGPSGVKAGGYANVAHGSFQRVVNGVVDAPASGGIWRRAAFALRRARVP